MEANDNASLREALVKIEKLAHCDLGCVYPKYRSHFDDMIGGIERIARAALKKPPRNCDMGTLDRHAGKWLNGDNYEYEFAYCSECGHMQWAGWDSHSDACESISDFHKDYKFCPNCGASMIEGVYINGKGKNHGSK